MRSLMRVLLALMFVIGLAEPGRAATDLSIMQPAEIEALQKRLTDDGCYSGPVDGQANPATADAVRVCPDQTPVLRIETGMHTARIPRIGINAACSVMATGSDDKTVRLWSLPDGTLRRTIRLPIGAGDGGKVFAVALSPDGRNLAAGGYDAANEARQGTGLYLTDTVSGTTRRVGAFEEVINHITFSPDGTRIALGLGRSAGIRVLDPATGRELMADRNYGDQVYGLAFARDGSLATTSYDGFIRRYSADLVLAHKVKAPDGQQPYAIAVDPDGRRLAIGYLDTAAVTILDALSLRPLAEIGNRDVDYGGFYSVTWSSDGQRLIAGGGAVRKFDGQWHRFLRTLTRTGKPVGSDAPVADDTITDLRSCGRDIVFAAYDPRFGIMSPEGYVRVLQGPVTADMRDKLGTALTVSNDAMSVRFGLGYLEKQPVMFDLAAGTLIDSLNAPAGLAPARVDGLPVNDWNDKTAPTLQGRPIALTPYEMSRSVAIRPDRSGFVLGTEWYLRSFDADGHERWKRPSPGVSWGVNLSDSGRIVVAAIGDGTIRWYRWEDGQELLALLVHAPSKRWVAWTPSGYYMASPGAEDLIGWQVNRGWNQETDFFPASRFRDKFNRPDVVRAVLQTRDEGEAVKAANAAAKRRDDETPIIERLPPVITILSPSSDSTAAPGLIEVRYRTRMPSGGAVDRVEAFVEGAKIEARGLGPARPDADGSMAFTLPMPDHDAEISLVAYADGKASDAARVRLKSTMAAATSVSAAEDEILKPTLYALLIGVTHYENKTYNLAYPAQDALGLAEALKGQEGKLYRHVEVKVLTDKDATSIGVKRGLSWLRKQTTAHDLAIVFAAGHGMTDPKGRFWFLTEDADPDELSTSAVSKDDIADVLYDLPGKKLLFLDACHSGAALSEGTRGVEQTDLSAAVNDFAQTEGGVVAYAASTGKEFSFENEQWGHGAFTKALLEGLGGQADLSHKGTITTASLDFYLAERVKELTNGRQHPVMTRPKTVPDFPIAAVQ